ncbi:metallo proteinase 10 [Marasmius fiardii PR-910]|nr:metallo proteinase 10 [Marasmius fiardii PR-910]
MITVKLLPFVFLGIFLAPYTAVASWLNTSMYATHRLKKIGVDLHLEIFHPPSNYKTFDTGDELPESFRGAGIHDRSVAYVSSQLNIDASKVAFKSGYGNDVGWVGYLKQMHDGVPFVNAVANVAFKDNKVVAFGQSFVDTNDIAPSIPAVDVSTVIPKVEASLGGKRNKIEPAIGYLVLQGGTVALVHVFQVQNEESGTWYEAYADAHSGELLSVTDFISKATYKVVPVWKQDITQGLETLVNPQNNASSPHGWHSGKTVVTAGNNVVAYKSNETATTRESKFRSTYNPSKAATTANNLDAARTNGFYLINTYHDVLYQYGFTEEAFNFQDDNFEKGGAGNDRVLLSIQDSDGTDNAYFFTPPDGQSGKCGMFIFTVTRPTRDGAMQNDIVIHEMTHGLTGRMTGGGTARCLQTLEAGGMGEGWSDAVSDWFAHSNSSKVADFVTGQWVLDNSAGVRTYPYSTSNKTNPLRYSSIAERVEVHGKRLVVAVVDFKANILHNVYAALVKAKGWSPNARTNANTNEGNVVFLRLLVDALAIQPCNPTLPTGRDAWIQADKNRYGGAHKCTLWEAFASRGLGVGAKDYVDSSRVPSGC